MSSQSEKSGEGKKNQEFRKNFGEKIKVDFAHFRRFHRFRAKNRFRRMSIFGEFLFKWILFSLLVGGIGGLVGAAFHLAVERVTEFRGEYPFMLYFLPICGILIVLIYHICGMKNDRGTNVVMDAVHSAQSVSWKLAPVIFITSVITHLAGGSAGREGAALQIGGSLGASIGRIFHLDEKDSHVIVLCGMSAVFSALFGTPITAAVFSLEVVSIGIMHYSALVPCVLASVFAARITIWLGIKPSLFPHDMLVNITFLDGFRVVVLAICVALVSIAFCKLMGFLTKNLKVWIKNDYIRIVVGGCVIIILTLIVGNQDYNGAGMHIIENVLKGGSIFAGAFLLKIIFTAITISSGYKGGEIVPAMFIGATFGSVFGGFIGLDPGFAASIGLVAMFCGCVNCPLASVFLSIEMFGTLNLPFFAIACAISYMMSGYAGLYSSQKIVYSKLRPKYINRKSEH